MLGKKECGYYYCNNNKGANAEHENVNTALFTALMVVLLVCLKRASVFLFVVEQWRAWVFVALNIVLLAIFFTSSTQQPQKCNNTSTTHRHINVAERKIKKRSGCYSDEACQEEEEEEKDLLNLNLKPNKQVKQRVVEKEVEENNNVNNVEEGGEAGPKLSKEELNERVEAFIAMFRQHLASDARKGRAKFDVDRRRRSQPHLKHINLSSDHDHAHAHAHGVVNCFVLKVQG